MSDLHVNDNSSVYYQGGYWNDLEVVRRHINARISGDPSQGWAEHFARTSGRTFQRALILNCGNGWVERNLVRDGLIVEAVGIDYSGQLLDQARFHAQETGLPLRYEEQDVNSGSLPEGPFDLVVNHAAAHHIAAIDGVFRELCRILPEDGWFVSFDYVGPHRNQYAPEAWQEAWTVNEGLPKVVQQDMRYPHLPTMLVTDPTEAIHSELILETFGRYFTTEEYAAVGGAIAYPLLTHNRRLFALTDGETQNYWTERILEADEEFLTAHPDSTLFAYFAGRPSKSVLDEAAKLSSWEEIESEREKQARRNGGEYYTRSALATAAIDLDLAQQEGVQSSLRVETLESQIAALNSTALYSMFRQAVDAPITRRLRSNRWEQKIERVARTLLGRVRR